RAVVAVAQCEGVLLPEQPLERARERLGIELRAHVARLADAAHLGAGLPSDLAQQIVDRHGVRVDGEAVVVVLEDAQRRLLCGDTDSARDEDQDSYQSCGEPCHGPNLTSRGLPPQALNSVPRAATAQRLWRPLTHPAAQRWWGMKSASH